ncbi:MAG: ABC transporter permease [Bacilli bacterium]
MINKRKIQLLQREIKKDKSYLVALVIMSIIILGAIFAFLSPYDGNAIDISNMYGKPTLAHPFGFDELGRDYFTRTLYGARISLIVGFVAMIISSLIGVIVGVTSGYFGGLYDYINMRILEVITSIPWMVLVSVFSIFLSPGLYSVIILIGFFSWMKIARLVRAKTLSLKESEYVLYAQASGQSNLKIMIKHILPGIFPIFIVSSSLGIASAIMVESTLSFLGLGIKAPASSWGSMIQGAQSSLETSPHLAVIPGLLILLVVYSINKIAQLIQVIFNPRMGMEA